MADAPERIWAWQFHVSKQDDLVKGGWTDILDAKQAEYIRADLVDTKPATDCRQQELTTEQARQAGFAAGIEAAAKFIDARVNNYIDEHGSYDGTTGVTEFPGNGSEWIAEQAEISEAIRALTPGATVTLTRERMDAIMDALYDLPEPTVSVALVNRLRAALAVMKGAGT